MDAAGRKTSLSSRATINPKGTAEAYAPQLKPLSQLEVGPRTGVAGSAREIARAEAARLGFEEGLARGFAEGEAQAWRQFEEAHRAAIEAFVEELGVRAERLNAAFREWCVELEGPLAELGAVIAARIVAHELETRPDTVLDIAKQALAEVTHAKEARIRVNPFDSEVLNAHKTSLLAASGGLRKVEIVDDRTIQGGCVVETEGGSIDARVESMLEQARHALRGDR